VDIEQARFLVHDADAVTLVFAATDACDVVREYLLYHATSRGPTLAHTERTIPWYKLEETILSRPFYPLLPGDAPRADADAWLRELMLLPKSRERDFRLLLCGLAACQSTHALSTVLTAIGCMTDTRVGWLTVGRDDGHSEYVLAIRIHERRYDVYACQSTRWGKGMSQFGPLGSTGRPETFAGRAEVVAFSRQIGVEPPERVIKGGASGPTTAAVGA
jgi:hypothetical protein